MSFFSFIWNQIGELLYPTFCCHCGKFGQLLCDNCYEQIEFLFLPINVQLQPSYLDSLTTACRYSGPIKSVIKAMKFDSVKAVGGWCGELLYQTTNFPMVECLTSIPLHPKRQRVRGFNQAEQIAQKLSELSNIPYLPLLQRSIYAAPQAQLRAKADREHHLTNHFTLLPSKISQQLTTALPSTVILIDDVVTTGTTLNECARVLKEAGVQKIHGLTVAHGL